MLIQTKPKAPTPPKTNGATLGGSAQPSQLGTTATDWVRYFAPILTMLNKK